MKKLIIPMLVLGVLTTANANESKTARNGKMIRNQVAQSAFAIVDTGLIRCYDDKSEVEFPQKGDAFFGQDGHYLGNAPSHKNNGDGTITDLVTGLIWQQDPGEKMTLTQALAGAKKCRLGGKSDWRVPSIKELYSLILFTGTDPDPMSTSTSSQTPFIDTNYFKFQYGNLAKGERVIDSQYGSTTKYVSTTMKGDATLFGVNFADGRIKGYGLTNPRNRRQEKTFYFIYVRGNKNYGKNKFKDNGKTITDEATGLTWMKVDSGALKAGKNKDGKMNWAEGLEWAENLTYAGKSDWRMPNIKELQSIVDYSRSPKTTKSAAIDPMFKVSTMIDEGGNKNYPFYWSSSSHNSVYSSKSADYIAFGEALGWMTDRRTGKKQLLDVHGAGCQRSDPKSGNPKDYPYGFGPQGDVRRIYNYVILVRGGAAKLQTSGPKVAMKSGGSRREGRRDQGGQESAKKGGSESKQVGSKGAPSFVSRLDKDNDGKVSKSEFDGPKNRFSHLDKDGDGYISKDEAPNGPPRRKR